MAKRNRRRGKGPSAPRAIGEEKYVPKPGPDDVYVQEGEHEERHYRNVKHPLDLAYERGMLGEKAKRGRLTDGNAERLLAAGATFRKLYRVRYERSGTDSSQALESTGGGDGSVNWVQTAVDASRDLERIAGLMHKRSYRILEYFCGKGLSMQESVMRVTPSHSSNTKFRLIEALEDLEDALDSARIRRAA